MRSFVRTVQLGFVALYHRMCKYIIYMIIGLGIDLFVKRVTALTSFDARAVSIIVWLALCCLNCTLYIL